MLFWQVARIAGCMRSFILVHWILVFLAMPARTINKTRLLSFKFSKLYCVFNQYFSVFICINFDIAIYHDTKLLNATSMAKQASNKAAGTYHVDSVSKTQKQQQHLRITTLHNVCAVYWGMCSTLGGVQYTGGCAVPWGCIIEYTGGCSVHQRDIIEYTEGCSVRIS